MILTALRESTNFKALYLVHAYTEPYSSTTFAPSSIHTMTQLLQVSLLCLRISVPSHTLNSLLWGLVTSSRNSNHPLNLSSTVLLLESISWSPSLIEMFTSLLPYNPVHVIAFLKLLRNCYFICLFPTLNK